MRYRKHISAIVPFNDTRFINNIKVLTDFELISEVVILNNSGHNISRKIHGKKVIVEEVHDFDHGGTRNLGARISKGDILLFMTQDARPHGKDFDRNIISSFFGKVKAVYGKHIPDCENPFEIFERNFVYGDNILLKPGCSTKNNRKCRIKFPDFFASDVCFAVDRQTFKEVGGFPENVISSEELILSYKIINSGYKIMYNPLVKVVHSHHTEDMIKNFKRWFDVGVFFFYYPYLSEGFYRFAFELFLREFLFFLVNNPHLIGKLMLRGVVRFIAMRLGLMHRYIPFREHLSLNKNFWGKHKKSSFTLFQHGQDNSQDSFELKD